MQRRFHTSESRGKIGFRVFCSWNGVFCSWCFFDVSGSQGLGLSVPGIGLNATGIVFFAPSGVFGSRKVFFCARPE